MPRSARCRSPLVLLVAVVLQVSRVLALSFDGVVPNLALLVVVAAALVRGPEFAAVLGFLGRPGLDLAPPADHVAGRWALALVVVGYLAGRVRQDAGTSAVGAVVDRRRLLVRRHLDLRAQRDAAARPGDPGRRARSRVIPVAVVYDVLLTPFVLPLLMRLFRRLQPHRRSRTDGAGSTPPGEHAARRAPPGPAAAVRGAGAGALAVRDALRAALVHAGARRRGLPGPGRRAVGARARRAAGRAG